MSRARAVFDPDDATALETAGLLKPAATGLREISMTSVFSSTTTSSDSTDSGYVSEGSSSWQFLKIPDFLESQATLQWLGFNPDAAKMLIQPWENWDPEDPSDFMTLVRDHVRTSEYDAVGPYENWVRALQTIGVTPKLRDAILDPDYQQIRYTQSAKYWVVDSMRGRFRILSAAQESSIERARFRKREAARKVAGTWTKEEIEKESPKPTVAYGTAYPQYVPGSITLWIGHDKLRFKEAFPPGEEVFLERMSSEAPSDFCGLPAAMLYTALDMEVAQINAGYAKRRIESSTSCLLSIQIPNALIQSLEPYLLYYGDE
ncbi:hypothetical protein MMC17_008128 [Xylographa soralifera]|nr:hypothetical protein [Xylographa soralifera]